ncbi:MAG: hypothetical protein K0R60_16 [Microbacterium sp.]|jgi:hypothetical protein|nr:hypothetical protein [Microbacterium sp.]
MSESTPAVAPEEVDPNDEAWQLEGDDSLGDAPDPTRNDEPEEVPS